MMLRCKLVVSFLCCTLVSFAQVSDTSIFFKHASTFDQLIPSQYHPFDQYIPDSTSLAVLNANPKSQKLQKIVAFSYRSAEKQIDERLNDYGYEWDAEGRVFFFGKYPAGDTAPVKTTRIQYLIGSKATHVTYKTNMQQSLPDSLVFAFNRSGWVGSWRHRAFVDDSSIVRTGNRMYDSRGNLIIATNVYYGNLNGTFLYEYNAFGEIIRRAFATSSGIILCTDTIEYAIFLETNKVRSIKHKLKILGSDKWVLLEEKTVNSLSGKVISYTDYNDQDENYYYRNYVQYTIRFEYDALGRVEGEYFGTIIAPDAIRVKYHYGSQMQPDSIVYEEQVVTKKSSYFRVYSRDVRSYDEVTGFIKERSVTTILFEEQKKKDKLPPVEVVSIQYKWE